MQTLATRQDSLGLTADIKRGGVATLLDLRQAEQLVDTAEQLSQDFSSRSSRPSQITLLLGQNPGGIVRGQDFGCRSTPGRAGCLPALLDERPDAVLAAQTLVAANANIGVAKAAYFPQIN